MPLYGLIKNRKVSIFLMSFQLFLILACRSVKCGMDLLGYIGGYHFISGLTFSNLLQRLHFISTADLVYPYSYESGYTLACWFASWLGFSFHDFLIVIAVFTMISVGVFVYRYSVIPWLSFVLFIGLGMYLYSFGILRQTIAFCILLWTIPYITKKNYQIPIVLLLLAFTFHRSSIIFAFLFFFSRFTLPKKMVIKYLITCIAFSFVSPFIYQSQIGRILAAFGKQRYIDAQFMLNNQIILMFLISILVIVLLDFKAFNNTNNKIILLGFLLSIPVEIIGMNNANFARGVEYFYIFAIILIPFSLLNYGVVFNEGGKKIVQTNDERFFIYFVTSLIILFSMLWLMIHQLEGSPLVPYQLYIDLF